MVIGQENKVIQAKVNLLSVEPQSPQVPTISVIIPTFNNAEFLPYALDSVFAQDFPSAEIIVIDDGSTDETHTVLAAYAAQIRYLYQTNAGSAVARNTGLQLARGEYIVFLDADDVLLPGKFVEQVQVLEKRPFIDMVHSGWQVIDAQGKILDVIEPWHQAPELDVISWFKTKPIRMGAMLFRRRCLEAVGGFDPGIRQSQDVDLMLRLALAGYATAWVRQPTVAYRLHAASTIRRNALKQHGYVVRVMNKFFAHPQVPEELRVNEHRYRYYNLRWLAWHLVQSGFSDAIIAPLRQALVYAPFDYTNTVLDLVHYFARFYIEDERDLKELRQLFPYLQQVVRFNDADWQPFERLIGWWLEQSPFPVEWPFAELSRVVDLFWAAIVAEDELGLSVETMLSWWVHVWWPYLVKNDGVEMEQLRPFQQLPETQLLDLIKFCIVQQPDQVTLEVIDTFWQDILRHGIIPAGKSKLVTGLHLTYFGQQLLQRDIDEVKVSLRKVLSAGLSTDVRWSWRNFITKSLDYVGFGQQFKADWLFVGEKLCETAALYPLLQHMAIDETEMRLASCKDMDAAVVGVTRGRWMPLAALFALAEANQAGDTARLGGHARFLRQWLLENYQFESARRLPRWKRPFRAIYLTTIQQALDEPVLLTLGYPVVCCCEPLEAETLHVWQQDPAFLQRLKNVLGRVTAVHCYTAAGKQIVQSWGVPANKIEIVTPGVDHEFFVPATKIPEVPIRLVMMAPLAWESGFEYAMMAVQMCVARGVDVQVDVVGEGSEQERLLFTRHDLDLETVVTLHRSLDARQRRALLQRAHIFMATPVADTWSQPLLEAMACGVPVVGTAVPTLMNIICDGQEGFVVPLRQPRAVANAIAELIANPQKRSVMGQAARKAVTQFDLTTQLGVFQAMLARYS